MTDRFPAVKFGLFALACLVAAAVVVNWTGNFNRIPFLQPVGRFEAVLDDASGLAVGDDVRVAGVRVGRVNRVGVERGLPLVGFELDPDVAITDTWEVGARWRNVIGQRYLYLYHADGGEPLPPGGRIPVQRSRPSADLGRFFNEITPLLRAIPPEQQNLLLSAFNEALDGNTQRVQELIADLGALGNTLAEREPQIRSLLTHGSELLETYAAREDELSAFIADLADVGGTLAARNDELLAAIADIGQAQQHFGELLRANDEDIRAIVDDLDTVSDTIGAQRQEGTLEEAIRTARSGLGVYMLISRTGQWFDVRAVAVQVQRDGQVLYCETERGDPCAEPNSRQAAENATSQTSPSPAVGSAGATRRSAAPRRLDALHVTTRGALGAAPGSGVGEVRRRQEAGG